MKRVAAVGWALCAVLLLSAGAVEVIPAPKPEPNPPSLDVRYAEAQLRLAELNLKRIETANRRVANAVPGNIVAEYREDVAVAQSRLKAAQQSQGPFQAWLTAAEAAARSADMQFEGAKAANEIQPGAVDAGEVERLRVLAEIARLRVARGKAVAGDSREAQLQWQVTVLGDEVDRLQEEVHRNPPVPRTYPLWWYPLYR